MKLNKKHIILNDRKIRYLSGGKGPAILFFHGWPVNPHLYRSSLEKFSEKHTVYAPYLFDLQCGSMREVARCVESMISKLKIKKASFVGVSFGGAVAALIAAEKPQLVSRLMLVNTAGFPRKTKALNMFFHAIYSWGLLAMKKKVHIALETIYLGILFLATLWKKKQRQFLSEVSNLELASVFKKIKTETIIVWSKSDMTFPISYAKVLQGMIKKSSCTTVEGIHGWPQHQPETFAKVIMNCLR